MKKVLLITIFLTFFIFARIGLADVCLTNSTGQTTCYTQNYYDNFSTSKFTSDAYYHENVTISTSCQNGYYPSCLKVETGKEIGYIVYKINATLDSNQRYDLNIVSITQSYRILVSDISSDGINWFPFANRSLDLSNDNFYDLTYPVYVRWKLNSTGGKYAEIDSINFTTKIKNITSKDKICLTNSSDDATCHRTYFDDFHDNKFSNESFEKINITKQGCYYYFNCIKNSQKIGWINYKISPENLSENQVFNLRIKLWATSYNNYDIKVQKSLNNVDFTDIKYYDSPTSTARTITDIIEIVNFTNPIYLRFYFDDGGFGGFGEIDFLDANLIIEDLTPIQTPTYNIFNLREFPESPTKYSVGKSYQFNASVLKPVNSALFEFDNTNRTASNPNSKYFINREINWLNISTTCSGKCLLSNVIDNLNNWMKNSIPIQFVVGVSYEDMTAEENFIYEINIFEANELNISFAIAMTQYSWERANITYSIYNYATSSYDKINSEEKYAIWNNPKQPVGWIDCLTFYQLIPINQNNLQNRKIRLKITLREFDDYPTGMGMSWDSVVCDDEVYTVGERYKAGTAIWDSLIWARVYYNDFYINLNNLPAGNHNYRWFADSTATNLINYVIGEFPIVEFSHSDNFNTIEFNASLSYDPDGSIVSYEWDFGDGTIETKTESVVNHTYSSYGNYNVKLTVMDNNGLTGNRSLIVQAKAKPGEKIIMHPSDIVKLNITIPSNLTPICNKELKIVVGGTITSKIIRCTT